MDAHDQIPADPASTDSGSSGQRPSPGPGVSAFAAISWLRDLTVSVLIAVVVILFLYQPVRGPDGSVIEFQADLSGLEEITRWVLSWGSKAKVLGPPELKKRVTEELAKMALNG